MCVRPVQAPTALFNAGQDCTAATRVLAAPRIHDDFVAALVERADAITLGDPLDEATDIGPVIDRDAQAMLEAHAERMDRQARLIHAVALDETTAGGTFFAPRAYEIDSLDVLEGEVFGPVLHVMRYKASERNQLIDRLNATGYGLTLGIHSRIDDSVEDIVQRMRVGNAYVNRNQVGAVVGVQPFGGQGWSGTGPKAGGPYYLPRFATEKTVTINTTATGGNASLLTLEE